MKELKDLVAGDDVLVTGNYHRRIAKVDKVLLPKGTIKKLIGRELSSFDETVEL